MDDDELLDLARAAEHLGVSPTVMAKLLDTGVVPCQATADARDRTVRRGDLDAHRDSRYARQQERAREARGGPSGLRAG